MEIYSSGYIVHMLLRIGDRMVATTVAYYARLSIPRDALPDPPPRLLVLRCGELTAELTLSSVSRKHAHYYVPSRFIHVSTFDECEVASYLQS